jgi:hypothetical protein
MGTAPTADAIGGVTTSTRKSKIETPADPIRADLETLPDHDLRLLADKVKERGIVAVDRRWGRARLLDVLVAAGVKSDILDEPALVPPPPPPPDLL